MFHVLSTNTAADSLVIAWILKTFVPRINSDCLDHAFQYEPLKQQVLTKTLYKINRVFRVFFWRYRRTDFNRRF